MTLPGIKLVLSNLLLYFSEISNIIILYLFKHNKLQCMKRNILYKARRNYYYIP